MGWPLYYLLPSGTSGKSWLKEGRDFIAVFSVGLLEGPESSMDCLTEELALAALNSIYACNTFQHIMI
jgi:hypothetical protein